MMRHVLQPSIARRITVALMLACALVWDAIYLVGRSDQLAAGTGGFDREMRSTESAVLDLALRFPDPRELAVALSGLDANIKAEQSLYRGPQRLHVLPGL